MWSIALLVLAVVSSVLWYKLRHTNKYRLDILALIAGGAAVMSLVDSAYSYFEEGVFVDLSWSAVLLSAVLVAFAIVLWIIILLFKNIFK